MNGPGLGKEPVDMKTARIDPPTPVAGDPFAAPGPGRCKTLAVCLAAAFLILTAPLAAVGADSHQRFILFNAEYNSSLKQVSKTTVFLEKRLFKLDTQTGETWVLIDVLQDGRDIRYWQKITETPQK
jgi:hypothetical protein